jgi:uncharacterized protein (TIGR02996 family)
MAVYFVVRCCYNAPGERHVRRFEHDTVLDWARSIWQAIPEKEEAYRHAEELLGGPYMDVLSQMFLAIAEEELPPPESMDEVSDALSHVYREEENHGPHHVQILADDGSYQTAVHVFDDHFRSAAPGRTDFLLLDGWELPGTWSEAPLPLLPDCPRLTHLGDGEGSVYAVDLVRDCRYHLEDLCGGARVEGLRVPELCRYVLAHTDEDDLTGGLWWIRCGLQELLASPEGEDAGFLAAIRDHPSDKLNWAVYSDWLEERGLPAAGLYLLEVALRTNNFGDATKSRIPTLDRIRVTPHMAQACKHEVHSEEARPRGLRRRDYYTQWIFFDDRWAAANPTVASGLLRFAARWDVLSPEGGEADQKES